MLAALALRAKGLNFDQAEAPAKRERPPRQARGGEQQQHIGAQCTTASNFLGVRMRTLMPRCAVAQHMVCFSHPPTTLGER